MIIEKNQHEQNPNEIIQRIKGHKNSTQFKLCDNCVPNLVKFNLGYIFIFFFLHSNEVLLVDYNSRTSLSLKSSSNRNIDL